MISSQQKKSKKWVDAYLSLGSNVGNRMKNFLEAEMQLRKSPDIIVKKVSRIYETSPVGPRQRPFLNSAIKIRTTLSPLKLLKTIQSIEKRMKRKKTFRWGPRIIDIDLILYGRAKIQSKPLTVPHPEFSKRKFVLKPLSEIAPTLKPASFNKSIRQFLHELKDPAQKVTPLK